MASAIDNILNRASRFTPREPIRDVITVLSKALGPAWSAQREIDCEGEASIIVLPLALDARPTFVLFEKAGLAHVGVVAGDDWEGDQGYASFQEAVAGIIDQTKRLTVGMDV